MKRLAGVFRPVAFALAFVPAFAAEPSSPPQSSDTPWIQITVDPQPGIAVAWADDDYSGDEVPLRGSRGGAFVLTNSSGLTQRVGNVTVSSNDPSRLEMVTLSATTGRTTHMASVMNPTGADVLEFDSGFALGAGESVSVTVDATPAGN